MVLNGVVKKKHLPFCLTRKVVIILCSSYRFPSLGPYCFCCFPETFPTKSHCFALCGAPGHNTLARSLYNPFGKLAAKTVPARTLLK